MFQTFYNEEQKEWHGVKTRPLYNPETTLGEAVLKSMQVHGTNIAQISDDSSLRMTYDAMRELTIRASLNLQKRGYKPGDVLGVIATNTDYLAPIVGASYCTGCPINALATSFVKDEIKHMFGITKPSVVFCDVEVYDRLIESLAECGVQAKIITMNGKIYGCEEVEDLFVETGLESTFRPVTLDGSRTIATILCTSGSTGLPKGTSLSHAALIERHTDFEHVQSSDIMLGFSEPFWLTYSNNFLWSTLFGATRIITTQTFSTELVLRLIQQYKITFITATVNHLVSIFRYPAIDQIDLTSLRTYCIRGNKPPLGMPTEFNKRFPDGKVITFLGMTELTNSYSGVCNKYEDTGTAGKLMCDIEAIVVDDDGKRCGPNERGEICLRYRYPFLGYYNNPEASKEAFDDDGFFRTGDVVVFDENNDLYVVDRKKDIIRYNHYQISASTIEMVLMQSNEIREVCVVGIFTNESIDLPAAAIIREKGSTITEEYIHGLVKNNLPDKYKLRGGIFFVDSFPKTASGKILRRKVREELADQFNASQ